MRKVLMVLAILSVMLVPVYAMELIPPEVPDAGRKLMPEDTETFGQGLLQIFRDVLPLIKPDLAEALTVSASILAAVLMIQILNGLSQSTERMCILAGVLSISMILLDSTHSMIQLGARTVEELSEYEKLLLPVLTTAIAAQGCSGTAAALYGGTAVFNTLISRLICKLILPMLYFLLALSVAGSCLGEELLTKLKDFLRQTIQWGLKTLISCFTAYMGITRVVTGAVDSSALKAAKTTISTLVPVVGKILSDASEAVLVGAGLMKNSIGIYGIYAILALFLSPFLKIGIHYLILRYTAAISEIFGAKQMAGIVHDFSGVMGLLLASTGTLCVMLLISCVCYLKGVG